jgi:hypothetical protein
MKFAGTIADSLILFVRNKSLNHGELRKGMVNDKMILPFRNILFCLK